MTPSRPYLVRAIYEWIVDNGCVPYINVDTTIPHTLVPKEYIKDNCITLDISDEATNQLLIDNEAIKFKARFNGIQRDIYVPMSAVTAIYAQENTEGMVFPADEYEGVDLNEIAALDSPSASSTNKPQFNIISGGKDEEPYQK